MSMRSIPRLLAVVAAVAAVVVGLPAALFAVASARFGHISPLHGMKAPWHWTVVDVKSWGRRLTKGLDSSAELVDLFFRVALVIGWVCVAIVIYTVIAESVFQIRHGMPSANHRNLGGLGSIGRKLATALVAVLPLVVSASPALAATPRAAATVVQRRVADLAAPRSETTAVASPASLLATPPAAPIGPWTTVEVQRGDSVWAIAERVANGGDVAAIAGQIVAANLGTVMNDGHRFSTPALIEPGWVLSVPAAAAPVQASAAPVETPPAAEPDSYVVEPGDSYWRIAQDHLDATSPTADVAAYTEQMIDANAPLLGYSDDTLLHPGDVVQLGAPVDDPLAAPVVVTPPVPTPIVELPVGELPAPTPPVGQVEPVVAVAATAPIAVEAPAATMPAPMIQAPTTLPATTSSVADTLPLAIVSGSNSDAPIKRGLAAAALLSAGAIGALEARRRQQLRSAQVGARLVPPTEQAIETETVLRSLDNAERLARLDVAIRNVAGELAAQRASIVAIEIADDGEIRLSPDRPATSTSASTSTRWLVDDEGTWRLPASVALADLAAGSRHGMQPCPALVHLGTSAGGDLFVDLEAIGVLGIDAPSEVAASIVRCAAASLAVSPFAESSRVFTVGLADDVRLGSLNVEPHESLAAAVEAARSTIGSITSATSGHVSTFALRSAGHGGEAWEPSLLLAIGVEPDEVAVVVALAGGGGRGVGAMVDRAVDGGAVLRAVDGDFLLEPLGRRLTPVGLSVVELAAVDNLLDAADRPLVADLNFESGVEAPVVTATRAEVVEHRHALIVSVLGPVSVHSAGGEPVSFERSKAQELVVWLSQHRQRPTRAAARTALWDLAVRDGTFSNVVSDARRAMAKVVTPPQGQEWIGRTMSEELPLHELVVCDADLLADGVAAARGLPAADAVAVLRPVVGRIGGMPFAGTAYLWPDAEGTTSSLVLQSTSAAAQLAGHYLELGDVDGVFWATGHGLKVLAGHEELIALRMRAHAHHGDLAGVRSEWESYERAINADSWAAAEPSPKLVELRRQLISPTLAS
jgi:hypothetical protein